MRTFIPFMLSATLLALSCSVEAPQAVKVSRIGYLARDGASIPQPFLQALHELGYIEGKNATFEYRTAEGLSERSLDLAAELTQLNMDIIVADGTSSSLGAKKATSTLPIVMLSNTDPVANGLVTSFARPGGNITGLVRAGGDSEKVAAKFVEDLLLGSKRLALLKEVIPAMSRVGILRDVESAPIIARLYSLPEVSQNLEIQYLDVRGPNPDFEAIFEAAVKAHVNALIKVKTPLLKLYQKQIADLAAKNGLALMSDASDDVEAGSLMSYGWNEADAFRRVATYVDKILKGAKPADLQVETWPCVVLTVTPVGKAPVPYPNNCEQPTKLELVINLKTAKQIGLTIPQKVLARADKVIK